MDMSTPFSIAYTAFTNFTCEWISEHSLHKKCCCYVYLLFQKIISKLQHFSEPVNLICFFINSYKINCEFLHCKWRLREKYFPPYQRERFPATDWRTFSAIFISNSSLESWLCVRNNGVYVSTIAQRFCADGLTRHFSVCRRICRYFRINRYSPV